MTGFTDDITTVEINGERFHLGDDADVIVDESETELYAIGSKKPVRSEADVVLRIEGDVIKEGEA